MPIIDLNAVPSAEPEPPSKEQLQNLVARRIKGESTRLFQRMKETYTILRGAVWENQHGLTPQEVFDAVGPDSAQLLQLSAQLIALINAAVPESVPAGAPYNLTINPDGTVVVGSLK